MGRKQEEIMEHINKKLGRHGILYSRFREMILVASHDNDNILLSHNIVGPGVVERQVNGPGICCRGSVRIYGFSLGSGSTYAVVEWSYWILKVQSKK